MKKELITLYGKATIERDVLYFQSPYLPFSETAFAQIAISVLWIFLFAIQFFREDGPKKNMSILVFGVLLVLHLPEIFDKLFKRSYASRIPLLKIVSVTTADDSHGFQTE